MGYTNKTSHYELPQYVANDKPSWLGDFNAAMLKIDTIMADNDATAEAANSAATGAQTQVAALSSQLSTIQGQVNTAVDTATTADGKATTAQSVATQANTTAGEAKTLAETAKNTADAATETANNALPKSGGTMLGELILSGAPTKNNGAATKEYVDHNAGSSVVLSNITNVGNSDITLVGIAGCAIGSTAGFYNGNLPTALSGAYIPAYKVTGNPFNLTAEEVKLGGSIVLCSTGSTTTRSAGLYYDGTDTYVVWVYTSGVDGTAKFAVNLSVNLA